mmetsp:Transcript_899/g.1813  ORF Transcript_899/g.1813 Transcript_899/m.1813 type:complete len:223 (+) Transcript_899:106-774(+)
MGSESEREREHAVFRWSETGRLAPFEYLPSRLSLAPCLPAPSPFPPAAILFFYPCRCPLSLIPACHFCLSPLHPSPRFLLPFPVPLPLPLPLLPPLFYPSPSPSHSLYLLCFFSPPTLSSPLSRSPVPHAAAAPHFLRLPLPFTRLPSHVWTALDFPASHSYCWPAHEWPYHSYGDTLLQGVLLLAELFAAMPTFSHISTLPVRPVGRATCEALRTEEYSLE